MEEIMREILDEAGWDDDGMGDFAVLICPHGDRVEPDGTCPHGLPSPLRALGLI